MDKIKRTKLNGGKRARKSRRPHSRKKLHVKKTRRMSHNYKKRLRGGAPGQELKKLKVDNKTSIYFHDNDLICPISHELFVDPILASDGFTYERDSLNKIKRSGDMRSPMRVTEPGTERIVTLKPAEYRTNELIFQIVQKYVESLGRPERIKYRQRAEKNARDGGRPLYHFLFESEKDQMLRRAAKERAERETLARNQRRLSAASAQTGVQEEVLASSSSEASTVDDRGNINEPAEDAETDEEYSQPDVEDRRR